MISTIPTLLHTESTTSTYTISRRSYIAHSKYSYRWAGGRACVRACVRVCINVGNVCGAVCAILHGTFGFIIPINILYVYLYNILYT